MTPFRWVLTFLSFATAVAASVYVVASDWPAGGAPLGLPIWAHLMALGIVAFDITARTLKVQLSARAVHVPITFRTALRVSLGGDFAASITPSRSGACLPRWSTTTIGIATRPRRCRTSPTN